jgi:SRSO17 transposase
MDTAFQSSSSQTTTTTSSSSSSSFFPTSSSSASTSTTAFYSMSSIELKKSKILQTISQITPIDLKATEAVTVLVLQIQAEDSISMKKLEEYAGEIKKLVKSMSSLNHHLITFIFLN